MELIETVNGGRNQEVKLLLDCGADVNAQGGRHGNALQACQTGTGLKPKNAKNPAHKSTLEQLNKPVIKQSRIYPERLEEGTVRILILHPGSASDDIKCDLRQKVPLTQAKM
jgi:hypothetical protein